MSLKTKITTAIIVILSLFGINLSAVNLGSVGQTGEYHATTTYSKLGVPLFGVNQVIKGGSTTLTPGTLGSVVITGAVAGVMNFMDATSTTDVSSTTITVLPASLAAGTYTFDLSFYRGLIIESTSGLLPTTTITYR